MIHLLAVVKEVRRQELELHFFPGILWELVPILLTIPLACQHFPRAGTLKGFSRQLQDLSLCPPQKLVVEEFWPSSL